jgi:hypothetical protein
LRCLPLVHTAGLVRMYLMAHERPPACERPTAREPLSVCASSGRWFPFPMRWHVDSGDDELVDVMVPLLCYRRRSVRWWRVVE